jgi:hypothetical protein
VSHAGYQHVSATLTWPRYVDSARMCQPTGLPHSGAASSARTAIVCRRSWSRGLGVSGPERRPARSPTASAQGRVCIDLAHPTLAYIANIQRNSSRPPVSLGHLAASRRERPKPRLYVLAALDGEANAMAQSYGWSVADLAAAIAAQILSETYDATAPSSARVARRTELAARLQ